METCILIIINVFLKHIMEKPRISDWLFIFIYIELYNM